MRQIIYTHLCFLLQWIEEAERSATESVVPVIEDDPGKILSNIMIVTDTVVCRKSVSALLNS